MIRIVVALLMALAAPALADVDPVGPARPQPDPRIEAEASAHFESAVALAKRGNHAAALAEFEKAHALVPRWEFLYNIGITQRLLFRYGAAIKTLDRYLVEGGADIATDRRTKVEAEIAELRKLVGEVVVTVDGAPARIEVDDLYEGDSPLTGPLLLSPGPHAIRATRPNEKPDEKRISVVSGERLEIRLAPSATPLPKPARLAIQTRPPRARVRIDDTPPRDAPWIGELPAGSYRVVAELAGHRTHAEELSLDAGQERTLTLDLVALPGKQPIHRRPAFWIAVGVTAIAATAGVIYLAQPEKADVTLRWP